MTKEQKRLLSGMLKDYMPDDIDYADIQKFNANGKAIPFSDIKLASEAVAKSMPERMSDEDVHEAADIAEQIKAELKRMLKSMNKEKPKKEKGMLSTAKEESNAKEDQIAKGYHQMPDGSVMKDSEMEEEYSTDVAKDLDNEGRGLKGYKPPSEPEKRGYKQDDGGNYSVDSTDDYWQTKEGYDAAMDLYGTKPAGLKSHLLYTILKPRSMIL